MTDAQQLREALWKMFQEHHTLFRHYETQRATVAASILTVAMALIGLITFDRMIVITDLPMTLLLSFVGVFGALFSAKQHEKASLHEERARECRTAIDATFEDTPLERIRQSVNLRHNKRFPILARFKVNIFWVLLYVLLAAIGATLSAISLFHPYIAAS